VTAAELEDRLPAPRVTGGGGGSPRFARLVSIVPGLGQLYYGAPMRALQYFAGVTLSFLAAAGIYNATFDLMRVGLNPILNSIALLVSLLLVLSLIVSAICFWIAASWDARQGTRAMLEGREHHPTWWFVKTKQFLFDDPDDDGEKV
jgi:TM2 domain-containing membrane protein YozV